MRYLLFMVLLACGGKSTPTPPPTSGSAEPPPVAGDGACIKTGCSGTICADAGKDVITTCEMKPEYACYHQATCEKQPDGACGWTQSAELTACLASPPAL